MYMKFRTRLIDSAMFANRKYKQTISKAFADFDRGVTSPNPSEMAKNPPRLNHSKKQE